MHFFNMIKEEFQFSNSKQCASVFRELNNHCYCSGFQYPAVIVVRFHCVLQRNILFSVHFINPLHPNISMQFLHTVLYTFPKMLTRRRCLIIKSYLVDYDFRYSGDLNTSFKRTIVGTN